MSALLPPPTLDNPAPWANKRIGLLGGTFNPPHAGHTHITHIALEMMQLDYVWWLVTPQNPLKAQNPPPVDNRMALCESLVHEGNKNKDKIIISDLETQMQTHKTCDSVAGIKDNFPHSQFVWMMGTDNALSFHTWNNWEDILEQIPTLSLYRGEEKTKIMDCTLMQSKTQNHVILSESQNHPLTPHTSYWILDNEVVDISSTQIREEIRQAAENGV